MGGLILLASYPKSGSTWLRAVLAGVMNGASSVDLRRGLPIEVLPGRRTFDDLMGIESSDLTGPEMAAARGAYCRAVAAAEDLPRMWKIHDCRLPSANGIEEPFPASAVAAVVHVVRDPRDVAVSLAHHVGKTVDYAIDAMADDDRHASRGRNRLDRQLPQFLSSWSTHAESWLDAPGPTKMHLMRYEDMIADPVASFGVVARFLGLDPTPVEQAVAASRFDTLRAQEDSGGFRERPPHMERFFRRGIAGGWRDTLGAEQSQRIVDRHGPVMRRLGYDTEPDSNRRMK